MSAGRGDTSLCVAAGRSDRFSVIGRRHIARQREMIEKNPKLHSAGSGLPANRASVCRSVRGMTPPSL